VVILTGTHDDALWGSLIPAGALGVLGKHEPMDDLIDAIVDIIEGKPFRPAMSMQYLQAWALHRHDRDEILAPFKALSKREASVLQALISGQTPAEIATAEFVSTETVRSQLKSAFRKLGVSSQLEAVALAHAAGWGASAPEDPEIS
jgi:two-component system nitrate/nitrite response regulator NarL